MKETLQANLENENDVLDQRLSQWGIQKFSNFALYVINK